VAQATAVGRAAHVSVPIVLPPPPPPPPPPKGTPSFRRVSSAQVSTCTAAAGPRAPWPSRRQRRSSPRSCQPPATPSPSVAAPLPAPPRRPRRLPCPRAPPTSAAQGQRPRTSTAPAELTVWQPYFTKCSPPIQMDHQHDRGHVHAPGPAQRQIFSPQDMVPLDFDRLLPCFANT